MWLHLMRSSSWQPDTRRRTHFDSYAAAAALPGDAAYKTYAFLPQRSFQRRFYFEKSHLPVGW